MYSNSVTYKGLHPCTEKCISGNIKKIQKLFGSVTHQKRCCVYINYWITALLSKFFIYFKEQH